MLENWSVFAGSLEHIYSIPPVAVCWCVRELCVRELGESKVCVRESCARGREKEEPTPRECTTKHKNPTQRCGEQHEGEVWRRQRLC